MVAKNLGPWSKLDRKDRARWHSLAGHCADVAAVFRALVEQGATRAALSKLAGRVLTDQDLDRLAAIAWLHDVGKANAGFQARRNGRAPQVGHIVEVGGVLGNVDPESQRFIQAVFAPTLVAWTQQDATDAYLRAILSHHGAPITNDNLARCHAHTRHWRAEGGTDPIANAAALVTAARAALPLAFGAGGIPLPGSPAFLHTFAGLVQLADWVGSNEAWFAYDIGRPGDPGQRFAQSYAEAQRIVRTIGFARPDDEAVPAPIFEDLFQRTPRAIQRKIVEADAPIALLEAETGAGKTEAALLYFARLYAAGAVDGLYFALPTRVAASQIHTRVQSFAARFLGPSTEVLRAVPGDALLGEVEWQLPASPNDFACDAGLHDTRAWAAERPKRFLAARIAVGTIDQALLAALQTRHAHMRAACLMRSLLVVDEVHASDVYMAAVLRQLLANHTAGGGRVLLMSATLGSQAAASLLSPRGRITPPKLTDALAVPYPLIRAGRTAPIAFAREDSAAKTVTVELVPTIDDAGAVAALAAEAAAAGAKVLVVRNTVGAAQATLMALEHTYPDAPVLSAPNDARTLHHGRFATADRRLLDKAVERALGNDPRPDGGAIVIGTQTLEQSLDIDADLLITDLAPMDVLLQRIGRLHRHAINGRPDGFAIPRVVVLIPSTVDFGGMAGRPARGFGNISDPARNVYPGLVMLRATHDLLAALGRLTIPNDNRELVEGATHADALAALIARLEAADPGWRAHHDMVMGIAYADKGAAGLVRLDMDQPFGEKAFPTDEAVLTRLGAADRILPLPGTPAGPFGEQIDEIKLPGHWAFVPPLPADTVATDIVPCEDGGFAFTAGTERLLYDRLGLRRAGRE